MAGHYYLFLKQSGGGCDHTIACGEKFIDLECNSKALAYEAAKKVLEDHGWPGDSDMYFDEAQVIWVVGCTDLPLDIWEADIRRAEKLENEDEETKARRALFAELKKEFESADEPEITCPQCLNERLKGVHTHGVGCRYLARK